LPAPPTRKSADYCFTGALDVATAGVFEAFAAFLLTDLAAAAGFAVVTLAGFLAAFFLETGAVEVVFAVELCAGAGALEGGVLCANIAAAVNIEIRIVRVIFVFSLSGGSFRSPLANPSCSRTHFQTLALAGDEIPPRRGIHDERFLMKKR
jgi:hypothetical protein